MRLQTLSKRFFSLAVACMLAGSIAFGQGTGGGGGGGGGGTGGGGGGTGGGGGSSTGGAPQAGIDIDPLGVLRVSQIDPSIARMQRLAALQSQPKGTVVTSPSRKVSLNRLEKHVATLVASGKEIDSEVLSMAGLNRIEYVFYLPGSQDIVLVGPAEKWHWDSNNRLVGLNSGRPAIRIEDVIVGLRAFAPNDGAVSMIGCSIDPTQEGLKRMAAFHSQFGGQIPAGFDLRRYAMNMKESLGMQTVSIKGVPKNSRFAQVLVEADYRMKLIGIGLQDPIIQLTSWIQRTSPNANKNALQRWYFQADYSAVKTNEDGTALHLQGRGVKLSGEKESVSNDGNRKRTGVSGDKASNGFTKEFTEKFEALADATPVFYEMRNLFDISVAAAFIQDRGLYAKSGWNLGVFADESKLKVLNSPEVNHVEPAINAVWKDSQLVTPIGGGVNIAARKLVDPSAVQVDNQVEAQRNKISAPADLSANQWWWD